MEVLATQGNKKLHYIIIFLIVVNSGALFVRTLGDDVFLIILFLLIVLGKKNLKNQSSNYNHILIMFLILGFHFFYHLSNIKPYAGLVIRLLSIYWLSRSIWNNDFWRKYTNIIYTLSILSLIGFIMINLFGDLLENVLFRFRLFDINFETRIYYNNMFFLTWPEKTYGFVIRNQSIFWEPGAFQFFLNLALIHSLSESPAITNKRNMILIITLLTTFSTMAYIILSIILFDRYIFGYGKSDSKTRNFISIGILSLIVYSQKWVVIGKFQEGSIYYNSYLRRLLDLQVDLSLFLQNPYWGYGYGSVGGIKWADEAYRLFGLISGSTSNSLVQFIGQMGIIIFLIYLFPLTKGKVLMNSKLLYILVILLSLAAENFIISPLFIVLLYIPLIKEKDLELVEVSPKNWTGT